MSSSGGVSCRLADGTTLIAPALYGSGVCNGFANTTHLPSHTTFDSAVARTLDLGKQMVQLETRRSDSNVFDRVCELRDGSGTGVGAPQCGQRRGDYVSFGKSF